MIFYYEGYSNNCNKYIFNQVIVHQLTQGVKQVLYSYKILFLSDLSYNTHRSHVVYKGDCSCGVDYIGETRRNVEVRVDEQSNPSNDSEPARHLRENPAHSFSWRLLCTAQSFHKRRIIEGLMSQQWSPSLNKQVHSYVAKLFPPEIT